jgi:hypothetical protein
VARNVDRVAGASYSGDRSGREQSAFSITRKQAMNQATTDQGQRVADPATVSGDDADIGEQDPQRLKDKMAQASRGSDRALKEAEDKADEDVTAVKPDHRGNDAGQ